LVKRRSISEIRTREGARCARFWLDEFGAAFWLDTLGDDYPETRTGVWLLVRYGGALYAETKSLIDLLTTTAKSMTPAELGRFGKSWQKTCRRLLTRRRKLPRASRLQREPTSREPVKVDDWRGI